MAARKVAERTSDSGEDVVASDVFEIGRGDGSRLRPSKEEAWADEEHDGRQDNGAERIDVFEGVQSDAAQHASGGIAEAVGHPGVRGFVKAERKEEHRELEDRNDEAVGIHWNSIRC
jgi:hypothetical protein